jgi:hypothetical protein
MIPREQKLRGECLLPLTVCALSLHKSNAPEDGNVIAETMMSEQMSAKSMLFVPTLPAPSSKDKPTCHLTSAAE